jgi:hypothetical protein
MVKHEFSPGRRGITMTQQRQPTEAVMLTIPKLFWLSCAIFVTAGKKRFSKTCLNEIPWTRCGSDAGIPQLGAFDQAEPSR